MEGLFRLQMLDQFRLRVDVTDWQLRCIHRDDRLCKLFFAARSSEIARFLTAICNYHCDRAGMRCCAIVKTAYLLADAGEIGSLCLCISN